MMATPPIPTLTQDQINQITQLYGSGLNASQMGLKAGMPLSQLVPAYTGLGSEYFNTNDPVRDQLVAAGLLQPGSDPQGNQSWSIGPAWQANVAASPLGPTGNFGGPSAAFGAAPTTPFTETPSTLTGIGGEWSKTPTMEPADPFSGIMKMVPGSGGAYDYQQESFWDKLGPGPVMGLMMGGLMGAGGIFGAEGLGGIGDFLFKQAGNMILGNNPLSSIQSLFGGGSSGGQQQPSGAGGGQMTQQQMQQFLPFLIWLSQLRGGGGNG